MPLSEGLKGKVIPLRGFQRGGTPWPNGILRNLFANFEKIPN